MSSMDLSTLSNELSGLNPNDLAAMFACVLSELGSRGEYTTRLAALEVLRCNRDDAVNQAMRQIIYDLGPAYRHEGETNASDRPHRE